MYRLSRSSQNPSSESQNVHLQRVYYNPVKKQESGWGVERYASVKDTATSRMQPSTPFFLGKEIPGNSWNLAEQGRQKLSKAKELIEDTISSLQEQAIQLQEEAKEKKYSESEKIGLLTNANLRRELAKNLVISLKKSEQQSLFDTYPQEVSECIRKSTKEEIEASTNEIIDLTNALLAVYKKTYENAVQLINDLNEDFPPCTQLSEGSTLGNTIFNSHCFVLRNFDLPTNTDQTNSITTNTPFSPSIQTELKSLNDLKCSNAPNIIQMYMFDPRVSWAIKNMQRSIKDFYGPQKSYKESFDKVYELFSELDKLLERALKQCTNENEKIKLREINQARKDWVLRCESGYRILDGFSQGNLNCSPEKRPHVEAKPVFVSYINDIPVGILRMQPIEQKLREFTISSVPYIEGVAGHPGVAGVLPGLIAAAIKFLRQNRIEGKVHLTPLESNLEALNTIYQNIGFEVVNHPDNNEATTYLLDPRTSPKWYSYNDEYYPYVTTGIDNISKEPYMVYS